MRLLFALTILFLTAAISVAQQPPALINPAGDMQELPPNATVNQVLDALDQVGQKMHEFKAKVSLTSGDPLIGDLSTRVGEIFFQKTSPDDARLHVVFDKRIDGKVARDEKSEYLLEKGSLIERDFRKHVQTKRGVVKPGEKLNLLKLGEGPFPLPIGQKADDVHKMFEVTEIPLTADEIKDKNLSNTIHLKLVPKDGTRFKRRFGAIDVWVDRKSNFPVQIKTQAPDGSDPHVTKLENVLINPVGGLKDEDFTLPKIDEQAWSLHDEPYRE